MQGYANGVVINKLVGGISIDIAGNAVFVETEELASIMARCSERGEDHDTYEEALSFLTTPPMPGG